MAERPLYTLYKNLKAQNYDVPNDYDKFESALTRDGKSGADNRHAIYENLKAQNFDVPDTYERFYSALFVPRSRTSSRAKGGSVPMSAADRARFSAGAAAISASAKQIVNNAGRYSRLKQRKQKQQKDFGRVNLGTHKTAFGGDANNVVKDDFAYNPETGKAGAYVTSDNDNAYTQNEAEQKQAILDEQNNSYQQAVDTGEIPSVLDVRDKNGNYDLQENIGKNGIYLTEEGAQRQFDKKLADAYARKKEIEALIAEDNRQHGNPLLSYGASIGAGNGRTAQQSDYRNKLATSLSLVTEQIGALEAVKQYPTSSWVEDALKALDNTVFTAKTWDFGLTDFATMGQMERIKTKMDNNIPLSGSDKILLKSKLGADAAAALEDEKMGNIYRWTKIAGQSLPFMADFFLTGGYGGITKGISSGALKFAAKRGMGKVSAAILKNTGIVAGDVIGSYAMAGTEQAMKTGADIMQRHLGNLYQDEKGDYKFGTFDENGNFLHEGGESIGTSLYKGLTSAMVENYTEKLFGHNYGIKKGAIAAMEKHGMDGTAQFFKNIGKSGWYTNSKKWMEKFGINGFGEEVMEEEIGIPLHALLDGDNNFSDLGDAKQQLDIIGGMAISVGSMYAMGAGSRPIKGIYNRAQYYRFRNKVNVADNDAQSLFGDNWADIKDKIDNATNEQMGGVLADILRQRDTMNKEQINAAVNYGVNLMKMRGYNIAKTAEMNAKEIANEPTTPEEQHQADIDNAYSEGHDADDADKHNIQLEQNDKANELAAMLHITPEQLHDMADEDLEAMTGQNDKLDQAIYDYQVSTAKYQGVMDGAQDEVDMAAHQAAMETDNMTDLSRGTVRKATFKATGGLEDYEVYIISGNIATHDDGSIDVGNSDDMIIYYDPTTGRKEHADAMMFADLIEELPAADVKAQAINDAKENAIKKIAGIIDGTVEVGSQFSVTDADGTEHTYEVLADNGDGTAMITIDGNVPTELVKGENVQIPYSFAELQQMKDLEDQKRLEAAKAEREQIEKERAEQQTQETEETQPSFDFNQILNDDGNVVLVDVLDEDGNTKYPDSKLFLIRDTGAKAKVVELKSDGTIVPHAVNKEDVAKISSMSLDEYKKAMPESSMIEDNSGENRGEKDVEAPTIEGETAAPETTETPATEQTPAAPAITLEDGTIVPMLEDGNPDFSKLTAEQTAELYDSQFGEDADGIVSGYVSDAKKALDKANNMTVKGKNFVEQKAAKQAKEKAIADAQAAYDSAVAIRDAYNERQLAKVEDTADGRKNLIEKARRRFARLKSAVKDDADAVAQIYKETVGSLLHRLYDGTGIDVTDTNPLTAEEYVASNLGAHSINYEGTETSKGVKQETGLSREDFAKTQLLAADGKGTTIDNLVHSLWENRPSNLDSLNTQDIRNALIGVLTSGFKASEARSYVENIRIAQAEKLIEEERTAAENAAYYEQQKAKEEEEKKKAELEKKAEEEKKKAEENIDLPAIDKQGEPINNNIIELAKWAKKQGLEIDPTSKLNSYADLFLMCKDGFGVSTLVPDEGKNINQVIYFPDNAEVVEQLGKLQEEFNAGRDLKHSSNIDSEITEGATFYDADTAREFKEFVDKKVEEQNKVFGEQRPEEDLPFSARDNGTQQTTSERAADVEKNKVDDMKVVDNIVGQKTRKAFERLAKMMGANIQWQYSDKLGNGWIQETKDADGNVHRTIFITLDSSITEGAQFIFGHEMTHQIKNLNPAAYNELTQLVLDTYGSDAFDKAVDETMQRYSDAGFSGRARDYYAEEVVADAVGEMIRDLNLAHTLAMKMSHPLLAAIHEILQKIKLAFFGTEYSDVTKNIIRSIEQAYVKTANGEVTNSETGEDVSFSLRQKPEPKKKGVGYKVFVLKDGKLYPPMVANPDGAATPVGVWLDADAAPIAGESKTGRPQVKQGGKGTQGGSGKLAYRPGWHLGVVPYAIQFNRKDADGNKTLFPKNFVFAEVEYAADVDYQEEARQEGINPSGKYQHSLAGLKHLPTDGYYMYRTNPNPETDPWVITGAMKVNRILTRAEQADLVSKAGREPQQIQEGDIVTDDVVNSINQEIADAPKFSIKTYHGSQASFDKFDHSFMGSGEGAQAYGWGTYVSEVEGIAKAYAKQNAAKHKNTIEFLRVSMKLSDAKVRLSVQMEEKRKWETSISYYENRIKENQDKIDRANEAGTDVGVDYAKYDIRYCRNSIDGCKRQISWVNERIKEYKEKIAEAQKVYDSMEKPRNLYTVEIPDDNGDNYLDWDGKAPDGLKEKVLDRLYNERREDFVDKMRKAGFNDDQIKEEADYTVNKEEMADTYLKHSATGGGLYRDLSYYLGEQKKASLFLKDMGIDGVKVIAKRNTGGNKEGKMNYVIFDENNAQITNHTKFSLRLKSAIDETETNPSDAQKESGNYKKGHIKFGGYDYTIENPKGSTRSGKDADGKEWKVIMHDTYGYIRGKFGKDGDHLDMFINDKADLDNWNGDVFVVDQVNPDGSFDEHKVMYGYDSMDDAEKAYLANYSKGWKGLGNITGASKDEFDKWLDTSNRKLKPFKDYAKVKYSLKDNQGNPLNQDGTLKLDKIKSVDELTDEDFLHPTRNVELPSLPKKIADAIGTEGKPVVIKKNIFERNYMRHKDVTPELSKTIFKSALYNTDLYGQNQKKTRPYNWVLINTKDEKGNNRTVLLEVNPNKDNVEIVHWHFVDERGLEKIKKQADREDGQLLILPSDKEEVGALSDPTVNLSAAKIDNSSETAKENGEKFSLKDDEYLKAVENGDMEKAQKMVNEAAEAAGYSTDSSYQGTSAFNGSAPWGNGYFLTKEERKEAWDNDEYDGDQTLGDYIHRGIDAMNLDFIALDPRNYRAADPMRKEAIDNVRNAIQKKSETITMYRSVPSDVKEGSFRNGDWVTPSRAYAVENAKVHGWGDNFNIIEQKVPVDEIWWDGNDIAEWGYGREEDYVNDTDFAYKNTKNNRKLLDAVTYDDNGNVIPLSQRFNENNADVRYSLKDEKTMFGMHNISLDKLRKAIKQGGFAAPSMGVIDSKNGIYSGYGEITLIPKAEKIAKRTGKNIGTYAADAWTPIYPPVEKKFGGNGGDVAYNDIESVPKEMQSLTRNAINSFMDGREADGLAYLYLHEKGKAPELVHVEGKYPKELHDEVKGILGKLNGIYNTTDEQKEKLLDLFIREVYDGNKEEFDNDIKKFIKKDEEFIKKRPNSNISKDKQLDVDWMKEHGYDYGALSRFVDGILRDAETSGKVDENATMKAAQQYIQDNSMKEDFDSWKEKLNDRYNVEEVIFAGYKPDGNRKYLPNTVENAVKVMKQDGKNASVGSASFSHFVASILKPMGTLDQIRKKNGNLTGNYEDVEKFQEKWQPVYDELADKMQPDAEPFDSYGMDRLEEAATQKNPKKYAKDEYGVDLTDEDINKLNELIEAVKNDKPSIYFETKFMRPYGLDEFEKAIVPNDTPSDVVDALKKAGIDVSSYERGNAEDRQKVTMDAINSSDNIRFSLKAMMEKPEGWKQANKKAIHIAEAIERDPKFSLKNLDGTLIKAGTYFSGGGLVEEGLKGIIDPVIAVEYDEKISGVYRNNFGQHIVTADVRDVDPKELVKQIDGEVEYFHASPVCKNYSQAKSNHAEVELDKETAASTAEFINAIKPKVVTIENVKGYKDSDAMKTITDALDANGYTWDADVYNAADYGGYTNRERLIVRAVRDGKLPAKPKKMARKSGWYEAVADIIPTLTEKKNGVAPWMDIRLKADGIDWRNIDKPLYVMGSAYADGKVPHAFADELLPTLRTKSGDVIVMPDGKVYRAMGRVLARVSGVSDDYKMPFSESLSHTIIGNGIPTQLTEHVIAPLLQNTLRPTTPEDGNTKFSLRYDQFEHDLNQWKKDNNLPKDAQRPTIPQRNVGESAVDFLKRVDEYRKQMALWKTAPTYEQHLLSDDTALGEFNRELQKGSVLKRIAFQDSMLAIRKAQEAIMKEVGVDRLNMAEDAYTAENRSHGKGKNEFEEYNNEFLQPLRKAYHQMKKILGDSYDNVRIYMMAKHGLERDAQMAFKKSLEADYEDVAQRSAAYKAYKGDMNRIINDSDLEFGRVDFNTWRQRDNALRVKYSPSYMNFRYDKMGIVCDYSGLSALFDGSDFEEAAHQLIKDIESKYVTETHNLWDATNAATKKILRDGYKAGMMSKDTYQYVRDMYSHYIPLRGWDGTTADQVWDYIGGGKGAFNQTLKKAHGRTSIADDPIAYIENMAESGILLNNKNWVKQHLMLLAQNHPTSLLTLSKAWYVKSVDDNGNEEWIPATPQITSQMNSNQVKAAIDAFEQKMEKMAQTGDATQKRDGLNIAYPQTHSEEREHEVRVMKDGEEYVIYVNGDPQLAQAMNNTRAHRVREIQSGKLDRAAAWLGRKMAAAYTSLSPLFIPSNYFRDLTMTLASTAIREDAKYNYLLRKNLATSWNLGFMLRDYQNGKLRDKVNNGNATPKEQMFYDFMMNGGETGFVSSLDVEDLKKKFKNDLKDLDRWKTNPVKVGHTIMDGIEFLNRAIEDSNRFAVYMTSIQYGRSIDEAVNDAKDVTLNFNRKGTGEYGWQMIRNLYLFINPAVQSLQTLGALVKHHPFKFTAVTASWLASGVLVPIVNAALMSMLGGDDDKDKYWLFTKWDRRNNLIMWVPFTHEYVKIPLAQEFRAFYGVGDMIASKIMGGELAEESWSQYAEDLLGQVVDMLPLDPTGYDGNIAVSLMPNAVRPIFELAFNVDFTGKPLFKDTEYNKYDPNFTKAYVGTPDWLVRASRMVNSIGNDYPDVQQNSIDAFGDPRYNLNNPAVVDHVLSSYLGGAYTMGSQVLGVLTKSLNNPKEIKVADIPLFSKFVSNPDDRPVTKKQGDEFWNMKENHDRAANTLSKLKKQAKVDGDYSMLERFYGSEEYKQYKQDDVKVKKYEEDKKKERAEESGEEYRPHKLNAEDIYKAHATPKDDFEDLKLNQLYTKLNGFKSAYDLLVDTASSQSDGYYNTNKAAIDAIDEISLDKQNISELKKGFLDDGKDAYNAEDMKQIRELRKKILSVLEKANKVVVANQKSKAKKK